MTARKFGFGCMRLPLLDPENPSAIDVKQFCEMTDLFLERDFTYFDTAYMYHQYESERAVKKALVERHPRDSYTLATKLPLSMLSGKADFLPKFEEQLEKTGVEYFDYYLLHNINSSTIKLVREEDPFSFAMKLKAEGRIRTFGFSFHDTPELLDEILSQHPETEFVQLQINYLDWESDTIQSRKNYEVCVKHGKPVVVMEPVKGGSLANLPPEALKLFTDYAPHASAPSWAIRFAASLDNVFMVLSGMTSLAQLDDNTSYMRDFKPLNEQERAVIDAVTQILAAGADIPCTACGYCVDGCPKHIPIPKYFSLYNLQKKFGSHSNSGIYYRNQINMGHGAAKDCVHCGQCARVCPQHLNIPELLADVSKEFDQQ